MSRLALAIVLPMSILSASALHAQTTTTQPSGAEQENLRTPGAMSQGTGSNDGAIPTIPESQIEPAPISSPYQFLSVATSADDFVIRASALAETNSADAEIKTMAKELSAAHTATMGASQAAAEADDVDIAKPGVDGEQFSLLGKLEQAEGDVFDRLFLESLVFVHQRTIAYYRGYEDEDGNLAAFAKQTLPQLLAQYDELVAAATARGNSEAPQKPAPAQ